VWLLTLFSAAASLVNAIELLFNAFPGQGRIKKQSAMTALSDLLDAARKAGLSMDSDEVLSKLSRYIDDYVAIQHAAGIFARAGAPAGTPARTRLDDRDALDRF